MRVFSAVFQLCWVFKTAGEWLERCLLCNGKSQLFCLHKLAQRGHHGRHLGRMLGHPALQVEALNLQSHHNGC